MMPNNRCSQGWQRDFCQGICIHSKLSCSSSKFWKSLSSNKEYKYTPPHTHFLINTFMNIRSNLNQQYIKYSKYIRKWWEEQPQHEHISRVTDRGVRINWQCGCYWTTLVSWHLNSCESEALMLKRVMLVQAQPQCCAWLSAVFLLNQRWGTFS